MSEFNARILVVDDEQSMREFLEIFLRREGYDVVTAPDVDTAVMHLEADEIDLVVTDMQMPEKTGLDLLLAAREISPETILIVVTAFGTTDSAIAAMKEGAYDYLTKPFKVEELRIVIEKALEKKLLSNENRRLRQELRNHSRDRNIIGHSQAMQAVYDLIARVAETKTNVLVSGESGTGKELVARAIHEQSDRSDQPFIAINCGAIPENLLESELFGHMKGAFTGAVQTKQGLFEAATGGTLFLDEIGELSQPLQVKLLRALQERSIRRVGDIVDRKIDVRIVSATNRHLEDEVSAGRFREDVYYRLNVIQLTLPPLRDRLEDIPLLAQHFIRVFAEDMGKTIEGMDDEVYEVLAGYEFPGNVRELENLIERAVALTRVPIIGRDMLPANVTRSRESRPTTRITEQGVDLETLVADYERSLLREALLLSGGVKKRAARLLGVSFRSFRYRVEKLGIEDPNREG
ncbi:MAG: sigma-54 dependent transcriptional regulator [Myxococcales bacterium]|nr:sigma-54-dependent Fis family transcriptional regulator [Myxococcales bacterium]HIK83604.1 sigma-54-dependent Fis family transcriptional regulator [Myxococcales bacterium]